MPFLSNFLLFHLFLFITIVVSPYCCCFLFSCFSFKRSLFQNETGLKMASPKFLMTLSWISLSLSPLWFSVHGHHHCLPWHGPFPWTNRHTDTQTELVKEKINTQYNIIYLKRLVHFRYVQVCKMQSWYHIRVDYHRLEIWNFYMFVIIAVFCSI